MAIKRHRQRERLQQQALARGIAEVILPAQHMTHLHQGIVHGVAEKKSRGPVLAPHDEIADVIGQETLRAVHQILELEPLPERYAEAQARAPTFGPAQRHLCRAQVPAGTGVARRAAGRELAAARELELERRAETGIDTLRLFE